MMRRANGILMHIASLPGNTGIGTLGKSAFEFVDFLYKSQQTYWQILPICPTSYGDSPYQSFSTFAGNPYFIDLDLLCSNGYLNSSDYDNICWGMNSAKIDYKQIFEKRCGIFSKVQEYFEKNPPSDYGSFCYENGFWLEDFSLFMAIKDEFNGLELNKWAEDIRTRRKEAVDFWADKTARRVEYYKILQYLFFKQWNALKSYANAKGIKILGDLPIYVATDSADVWANPRQFILDENYNPIEVAGCPPDAFSSDGQLWGNPVYDWEYMQTTDYEWWVKRLGTSLQMYDVIRIDHFRGFDSYYCIKFGEKTAQNGIWRTGPGIKFFHSICGQLGSLPIIAEDLGYLTDSVRELLQDSGYPGMKVLQFAFDSSEASCYLPHNYTRNCVVYTGTHDNDTLLGWVNNSEKAEIDFAREYLNTHDVQGLSEAIIRAAMMSVAHTCILTMQDLIGLGSESRMNTPATVGGNWEWRMTEGQINPNMENNLARLTKIYGRAPQVNHFD